MHELKLQLDTLNLTLSLFLYFKDKAIIARIAETRVSQLENEAYVVACSMLNANKITRNEKIIRQDRAT